MEGHTWGTIGELQAITAALAANPQRRAPVRDRRARRALDYTPERFDQRFAAILDDLDVAG